MPDRIYLELSEGNAHKFYETIVDDCTLTIRYGRIGDAGQTQQKTFPSSDKATAEAAKKIKEKKSKGYEEAVQGVRQKRAVTRRSVPNLPPRAAARQPRQAPVLWRFQTGASALGIFVDDALCWVGNEKGDVYALDHQQQVQAHYQLPDGVKGIVADDQWLYASCDDGNVYDLSAGSPRIAYKIAENVDIYWIDIRDGVLAVSDALGNVYTFNHEDETQWSRKSTGDKGWMVRCDELGVYHGHSLGVSMYDWVDGTLLWTRPSYGWIGFGWQEEAEVFASTALGTIHRFSKKGDIGVVYPCDGFLCSCATSPNGGYVFGGDAYGDIYCFAADGTRLWKLSSGCGAAQSMQYFQGKLYIVTNYGWLACLDASESAIEQARGGVVPDIKAVQAGELKAIGISAVEKTQDRGTGVILQCVEAGGQLRVKVDSSGYKDWFCQFPKDIREKGAQYVVEGLKEGNGFYRVVGKIKKLV